MIRRIITSYYFIAIIIIITRYFISSEHFRVVVKLELFKVLKFTQGLRVKTQFVNFFIFRLIVFT